MPVTKQAIKKVRADRRKTIYNLRRKKALKKIILEFKKKPTSELLRAAFKATDLTAKTNVIHKNKAARIKSRLSKLVIGKAKTSPKAKQKAKTGA